MATRLDRGLTMRLLGAHMSIAGGFHKAVEAAAALGMETVQIFTSSPSQWAVKPLAVAATKHRSSTEYSHRRSKEASSRGAARTTERPAASDLAHWQATPLAESAIAQFRDALAAHRVSHPVAHASYLINLAAIDELLWSRSTAALLTELQRAESLGLAAVIVHPGALTGSDWEVGKQQIVTAVQAVLAELPNGSTRLLLENTAGQGSCVGHRFEQLAELLAAIDATDRVGICLDTCHAHAAGYALDTPRRYQDFRRALTDAIPISAIAALHLNDSQRPAGSRIDRHEHIGRGTIGLTGFKCLFADRELADKPMYLETPKGTDPETGADWDAINLKTLRKLSNTRKLSSQRKQK
jgi:deoxyribonuclease-4